MTKAEYGEQAAAARTLLDARFAKWKEGDEWQKRELCKALDALERRIRLEEMYIGKMGPVKNVITPFFGIPEDWAMGCLAKPHTMYKVVTNAGDKLVSIYDGKTEYWLGDKKYAKRGAASWPPIDACYFVFPTRELALNTPLPEDSKCLKSPRVLIEVRVQGLCYKHRKKPMYACTELVVTKFLQITNAVTSSHTTTEVVTKVTTRETVGPPPAPGRTSVVVTDATEKETATAEGAAV